MRFFYKIILLIGIFVIYTFNYNLVSIDGGFKSIVTSPSLEDESVFETLVGIKEIHYYLDPTASNSMVFILETSSGLYLDRMTTNDAELFIKSAELLQISINSKSVIPIWGYLIVGIIILILPRPKKQETAKQ